VSRSSKRITLLRGNFFGFVPTAALNIEKDKKYLWAQRNRHTRRRYCSQILKYRAC